MATTPEMTTGLFAFSETLTVLKGIRKQKSKIILSVRTKNNKVITQLPGAEGGIVQV